jgi:hypothetical protein
MSIWVVKKIFLCDENNLCILLLMHVGTTRIFTLIKSHYNIDRGGVMQKHIYIYALLVM